MRAIAIREHPDERVRIVEVLPDTEDLRAVLDEQRDLLLAEPLVQFVDATLELTDAVTVGSAVYMRISKQREFGATFRRNSPAASPWVRTAKGALPAHPGRGRPVEPPPYLESQENHSSPCRR